MKMRTLMLVVLAGVLGAALTTAVGAAALPFMNLGPISPAVIGSQVPVSIAHSVNVGGLYREPTYDVLYLTASTIYGGYGISPTAEFYAVLHLNDGRHLPIRMSTGKTSSEFRLPKGLVKEGQPVRIEYWAKDWGVSTHETVNVTVKHLYE